MQKAFHKAFADKSSTDIRVSKIQISKIIQSGGFLARLLAPLQKTVLPLMKNVIKPWSVLIPLGITAAASADAGMHKKILGSGNNNTMVIISNDEMKDY